MQAKRVSRQARGLQGGMYEAVRIRMERGLSESREKNNDFFRIPTRFTTRNIPLFPTMRRKDSDKPLPPIKRPRALRQSGYRLHECIVSPPDCPWPAGLAKWRGEGRTAHESRNTAFDQARGASQPEFRVVHETRDTKHESRFFFESRPLLWRGMGRLWRGMGGDRPPHRQHGFMHFTKHETRNTAFMLFFPLFPAKKMSQSRVASQSGRGSRGPGRVPRAAPRQPGCTVEQTNHETRSFLAPGASQREFRGFHESRVTKHESRLFVVRLWRGMGGILPPAPASLPRPPFSLSLTTRAVRWESRQSVQNPASRRKMRQA